MSLHPSVPADKSQPHTPGCRGCFMVMNCNPQMRQKNASVLTWLVPKTPGINLCCDINGMFILGCALRVTGHKDKAKRNRLQVGMRRGGKNATMLKRREGGRETSIHDQEPRGAETETQEIFFQGNFRTITGMSQACRRSGGTCRAWQSLPGVWASCWLCKTSLGLGQEV